MEPAGHARGPDRDGEVAARLRGVVQPDQHAAQASTTLEEGFEQRGCADGAPGGAEKFQRGTPGRCRWQSRWRGAAPIGEAPVRELDIDSLAQHDVADACRAVAPTLASPDAARHHLAHSSDVRSRWSSGKIKREMGSSHATPIPDLGSAW